MASRSHTSGAICAIAGAALWGVSGACAQYLLAGYGLSPVFLTAARSVIAVACFVPFALLRHRKELSALLHDRSALLGLMVFGVALYLDQITYTFSVGATNAGTATVLQSLSTAFILIVACVKARLLPTGVQTVGLALALASTWLIATQGDPSSLVLPLSGLLWGLANAWSVVLYVMWPQRLYARFGSFPVIACGMVVSAVVSMAVWLVAAPLGAVDVAVAGQNLAVGVGELGVWMPLASLDAAGWAVLVLGLGVLGTFVSFGLYLHGVSVVGSVEGGMLGAVEPASATVLSAFWLGSAVTMPDWLGLALMVAMIVLVSLPKKGGSRASAA